MHSNPLPVDSPSATEASKPARWLLRLSAYRQPLSLLITALLFALGLFACWHLLRELDPDSLRSALHEIPDWRLLAGVGATALSFIALLGYEWSACRYTGVRPSLRGMAMANFCASAIGNAIGFALFTGGSVRYRLYSREKVSNADIARITLFASLALGCALPPLAALAALLNPSAAAQALHLSANLVLLSASAVLLASAAILVLLAKRRDLQTQTLGSVLIRLGKRRVRLPGLRLSALQLLITLLDVSAAAAVLYLLLPEAPPFTAFILVYLLALAAGVLSHIPGGVGVFEAVLLAAFANQLGAAPLAAALLLYRLIYIGLPLLLACILLLANEAGRWLPAGRQAVRFTSGLAAPILATMVFLSGVVLLFSGATPASDTRLEYLSFLVPHRLIDASHLAASLVGVLCLLLAHGLHRRLSAAWMLTICLLIGGAGLSILKGFDWEEASLLLLTAGLLLLFRHAFYRPSRLLATPLSLSNLVASAGALAASLWLMFFAYQDVPYSHELLWQFAVDADAPRTLRAALASGVLLSLIALLWLLRPSPMVIETVTEEQLEQARDIVKASNQPDGGLVLTSDKALLFNPAGDGFLMFARHGRSLIALFDPIGPPQCRAELIWQFRDLCDLQHARPVFYQVRAENLPYYMDIGLTALKLGEEARVNLLSFDLEQKSKAMKDLRYTLSRGQRDGLQLHIYPAGQAPLDALEAISSAWMLGKNVREKGFSLGRFDTKYLQHFRIAVINFNGAPVAFANLLETSSKELASLDLMRVHPDAPKLTMEFLMLNLLLHFKDSGHERFSLGMVPLAGLQLRRGAPFTQRLGSLLYQRGEQFYNFQGLRRFKDKFMPDWEPRYMAVPAGLDPLVALADTAALIAGGYSGLVKR
ncbi:bifunctional lysylphosphatidylglycerol flippase/synthetase MprF [Pseudomonas sp. 5P_3.1_Bac2]|uniref:bifunctional lysylphosphatidylglycerol flippase/synthetase MprF n=1 Tax=Pseudomonas sp. 5P_3.1_Bac2 TaxID=2971617 RepID=UPI0021C8A4C2|nr:bifunctional lysylphosphatidylglycerol flippase/synthetase MprF [Pseudomonas sp. 5P_3.1_Bac2]MCU1716722.1 bifunctional lysylphosphatidylglycerol flippase/synthetase MprF [Pseudomonas sp. 5P_3.1_Bac2]